MRRRLRDHDRISAGKLHEFRQDVDGNPFIIESLFDVADSLFATEIRAQAMVAIGELAGVIFVDGQPQRQVSQHKGVNGHDGNNSEDRWEVRGREEQKQ